MSKFENENRALKALNSIYKKEAKVNPEVIIERVYDNTLKFDFGNALAFVLGGLTFVAVLIYLVN